MSASRTVSEIFSIKE